MKETAAACGVALIALVARGLWWTLSAVYAAVKGEDIHYGWV